MEKIDWPARLSVPLDPWLFQLFDDLRKTRTPVPSRSDMVRLLILEEAKQKGIPIQRDGAAA